jgi:hypothetical protein
MWKCRDFAESEVESESLKIEKGMSWLFQRILKGKNPFGLRSNRSLFFMRLSSFTIPIHDCLG